MIKESPQKILTQGGISILFSQTFQNREFVLQVLQIDQTEDAYNVFLSDGLACVKGQLINQAKRNAIQWKLMAKNVIKFNVNHFKAISHNEQYSFRLRSFAIWGCLQADVLGQPTPFHIYKKRQNFPNLQSGSINLIQHYNTITEVKQMAPSQLNLRILARVVKKPDRINSVMNIMIQDEEGEQIQCCFFAEAVSKYRDLIQVGTWYYFQDPILQFNNIGGMMELKFNLSSKVTKSANINDVKPGIINHNNNHALKNKQDNIPKEFNIKQYSGMKFFEQTDKYIIARPIRLFQPKSNMGKVYTCIDRMGNQVQILLWNDCNFKIVLNETYRFDGLKAKIYKQKISLQSQRCKTQVTVSSYKIVSSTQAIYGKSNNPKTRRPRYLGQKDVVYGIRQMRKKCEKSSEKAIIVISCGFITLKLDNINGNSIDLYTDLRKKLFYVHCEKCESNEYQKVKIELENMNGNVICSNCKSEEIRIMWNIKAVFVDHQTQLACKINSQIAQKLIDMTPVEGVLLYLENPDELKSQIINKLHYKRGVFKFSSKANDRYESDRYYNICQYYQDTEEVFEQRAQNRLKAVIAAFNKYNRFDRIKYKLDETSNQNPQNQPKISQAPIIKRSYMEEQIL